MKSEIYQGDALTVLKTLPSESVQTCVTSPPFYGLRDYGVDGQIGLEKTPAEFLAALVAVFEEVRRVLKPEGTCWVNLGDSYAGSWGNYHPNSPPGKHGQRKKESERFDRPGYASQEFLPPTANLRLLGLKPKDLIGIPWRVAFALQEAGWYLRQDIIWAKPNPMPESVTDRCTKSHEYIFLLTKNARYYYDNEAIKEPVAQSSIARLNQDVENQAGSDRVPGKTNGTMKAGRFGGNKYGDNPTYQIHSGKEWKPKDRDRSLPRNRNGITGSLDNWDGELTANKRSVWTVTTRPFKEAHFATFPEKLIEPCILAGSREGDTVLDPFNGAGTTGLVSLKHRRNYIGIELNPEYVELTRKRLAETQVRLF